MAQPFVLCSLLGIAWSIAHSGLEMLMGSGTLKVVGMFVALGWAILLWLAARGRRWTLYGAFIAGALACYYLAVAHFGPGVHVRWIGIVPWMLHPERAAGGWVTPYNLVVDAGVVIGVAILWSGIRVTKARLGRWTGLFALLVAGLIVAAGVARAVVYDGVQGGDVLGPPLAVGAVALMVMALAIAVPQPNLAVRR